ncbi:uncharacterized protein LOC120132639 [Hibiscus syriacus]|uniref:uncharacterized protein LOC120132639 n=1 Tax=Hibiscus syriacus TaxID=106335 RepID=UPI00192483FA|nr:uncharacterized protein LOC120132639 [Hibiscus syriacus]
MLAFVQNDSPHFSNSNNLAANIRREHSQISPQMSTSWFDQYGAIKNGKMLPVCDAQKIALMNATEKAFIVGRAFNSMHVHSSEHDAGPLDKVQQSSNFMPISTEYTSPHSLPPDITSQNSMVARAMKRKSMTFEFLPWHREVTQGSQRPQNISVAEVEWAHAANRLIEKVEDEPQIIEDWPPMLRSKRRLVLTTQLLQQLLRSPPRVILSADASKNCETLACFVSRSVLGDACSMAYIYLKVTQLPPLAMEACKYITLGILEPPFTGTHMGSLFLSEKQREQRNQSLVKAAEEFISIAKMLEDSLQSLVKRASILDLRLEYQDQEKVSVITRFAKFHGRGQPDGLSNSLDRDTLSHCRCLGIYPIGYNVSHFDHKLIDFFPLLPFLSNLMLCAPITLKHRNEKVG